MRCDIDTGITLNLNVDIPTFSVLQTALTFYVERAALPAGHPAREMMWKFAAMLSNLQKSGKVDSGPLGTPSAAPALTAPAPGGIPTPPLAETVTIASVEAPEEDWNVEEENDDGYGHGSSPAAPQAG